MSLFDSINKLLGDPNEKELKKIRPSIPKVRAVQESKEMQSLTLADLPEKTEEYKKRISEGESVDDLMVEAFALVCRACELLQGESVKMGIQEFVWNMVPYDVQIIGGVALHRSCIAEMKTGEGKTLVCTMPVYLNALTGKGVHVVTVNDYLAKRDSVWMGMLYEALGLSVGLIVHEKNNEERKEAYLCDVTYGTNNEFGFDYLRDNMATSLDRMVQRKLNYAIVDEVDSILIDEARTPLIISQPGDESTDKYGEYAQVVKILKENVHFIKDEKQKVATLTEEGIKEMERILQVENIYTERGFDTVHHIEQALRSHAIYQKDVDYVCKDGEIIIVDEYTGRLMPGRRFSHGLHQALEAKEEVTVQRESKTLATITFQNYFRLFNKLSGMTGTAKTEEEEFRSIYELPVIVIPTNKPILRDDKSDAIYKTVKAKFTAVAELAKQKYEMGQPVLIGTTSIEKSEALAALLERSNVPHEVLNAKHHEKEAEIVAKAGQKGSITIATNMAGRGTDIKLGEGVAENGGLTILGTERHESRRVDNQLRGRSGRQGDSGESQFFVSMEDDLMRLFGGDRLKNLMDRLNVPDSVPLETGIVSRSIESAQKRVEGRNFDIRRHVVRYDDVMNKHREIIYKRRQKILEKLAGEEDSDLGENDNEQVHPLHQDILLALRHEAKSIVQAHARSKDSHEWGHKEIIENLSALSPEFSDLLSEDDMKALSSPDKLEKIISDSFISYYENKCSESDPSVVSQAEQIVTLQSIDTHWMNHIDDMSHLREQVAFSGFAQRDPLIEYKDQGFRRFAQLLVTIDSVIVRSLIGANFEQFAPMAMQRGNDIENLQTN
ncbi:preprotein translocase subunit SecA, partial [Candidatus Peregrinibacteria bacterium]|nr:preprotein translocase subunit SecA [Candidatus Peregrinibacteria bacterium]